MNKVEKRKNMLFVLFSAAVLLVSSTGCSVTNIDTSSTTDQPTTATATIEATAPTENSEPEHGTSAYVDYIAAKAKEDAITATDEQLQEAVDWLKNNTSNYFSGEENMEKTMYYGELLEYKYKGSGNDYEKVGWQAFKTIKYVYRGVESVLDQVTHDNLMELQDMVEALPNDISIDSNTIQLSSQSNVSLRDYAVYTDILIQLIDITQGSYDDYLSNWNSYGSYLDGTLTGDINEHLGFTLDRYNDRREKLESFKVLSKSITTINCDDLNTLINDILSRIDYYCIIATLPGLNAAQARNDEDEGAMVFNRYYENKAKAEELYSTIYTQSI